MTEEQPNARLHTNVICLRVKEPTGEVTYDVSLESTAARIPYWELLELTRRNPLGRWSISRLTEVQERQKQLFLDPGPGNRRLYPTDSALQFSPFPHRNDSNPFLDEPVDDSIVVHEPDLEESSVDEPWGAADGEDDWFSEGSPGTVVDPAIEESEKPFEKSTPDECLPISREEEPEEDDPDRDEQLAIIEAPVDKHFLVTAPPGTGKTHVLVQRLAWLISQQHITNPHTEAVVLSFSRAAVGEVNRRIQSAVKENTASDDLRYVDIRTFDSYATRMLMRGEDDSGHLASGFLSRIQQFTEALQEGKLTETAREEIAALKCLVIDEVQDLIGSRAEMTLALMDQVCDQGGTVMLLGDPAQAIYDPEWAEPGGISADEFLARARKVLGQSSNGFRARELTNYRRFKDDTLLKFVRECRAIVSDDNNQPDFLKMHVLLADYCDTKTIKESLNDIGYTDDRVAMLTRNNLELFQASEWCKKNDFPCRLQRGRRGQFWPGWIAQLLKDYMQETMTVVTAEKRWAKLFAGSADESLFDRAKVFLADEGLLSAPDILDVGEIVDRIARFQPRSQWNRLEIANGTKCPLTISTIHGSKGLEFDRVLVLESSGRNQKQKDQSGETRVIYVAATRGSKRLSLVKREPNIFSSGNTFYEGNKTHHFQVKEKGVRELMLVNGFDEFDMKQFWDRAEANPDAFKSVQKEIWELLGKDSGSSTLKLTANAEGKLCWKLPSNTELCPPASDLAWTLRTIGTGNFGGSFSTVELHGVPVVDVATVDRGWNHRGATTAAPGSRLALMPVVYGMGWILKK